MNQTPCKQIKQGQKCFWAYKILNSSAKNKKEKNEAFNI